jgi:pseudouridylate synthase / pseudouridine kinase
MTILQKTIFEFTIFLLSVFFEPTDLKFAGKPFQFPEQLYSAIHYVSPNIYELRTIVSQMGLSYNEQNPSTMTKDVLLSHSKELSEIVCSKIRKCIVTLGDSGALISTKSAHHYYAVKPITKLVNVSGAGDSFVSGYITAMLKEYPENICVALGFKAANRALMAKSPVPDQYFQCFNETVRQCLLENIQCRLI